MVPPRANIRTLGIDRGQLKLLTAPTLDDLAKHLDDTGA